MKQYGNIVFGEQGLKMTVAYTDNLGGTNGLHPTADDITKALECAKDYIKGRMAHCIEKLNQNAYRAKVITRESVIWETGHFEKPVYDSMEEIDKVTSWDELNGLQLQQIVRAIHFNSPASKKYYGDSKELAFNIATEYMVCMISQH